MYFKVYRYTEARHLGITRAKGSGRFWVYNPQEDWEPGRHHSSSHPVFGYHETTGRAVERILTEMLW
jgi:hypothetical protein